MSTLSPQTFERFRQLVYQHSGISLGEAKATLVQARIGKRMRALDIHDHQAYLEYVEADTSGEELILLLDAISTNVTSFFREPAHFVHFADILKQRAAAGQRRFRIWSAASSTGEEPYSIAMVCREVLPPEVDLKILATDISTKVLQACKLGRYRSDRLKGLSTERQKRFLTPCNDDTQDWQMTPDLRSLLTVRRLNLSKPPFPMRGPLDAVFCRNVMIYFDRRVRHNLLTEITRLLPSGGRLFVGHAESLTGMESNLRNLGPAIYGKD